MFDTTPTYSTEVHHTTGYQIKTSSNLLQVVRQLQRGRGTALCERPSGYSLCDVRRHSATGWLVEESALEAVAKSEPHQHKPETYALVCQFLAGGPLKWITDEPQLTDDEMETVTHITTERHTRASTFGRESIIESLSQRQKCDRQSSRTDWR
eukprot:6474510-Amphidinium_carterae.1